MSSWKRERTHPRFPHLAEKKGKGKWKGEKAWKNMGKCEEDEGHLEEKANSTLKNIPCSKMWGNLDSSPFPFPATDRHNVGRRRLLLTKTGEKRRSKIRRFTPPFIWQKKHGKGFFFAESVGSASGYPSLPLSSPSFISNVH